MRRGPRGGPGELGLRLARAEQLLGDRDEGSRAAREPLALLVAVLRYQQGRSTHVEPAPEDPSGLGSVDTDSASGAGASSRNLYRSGGSSTERRFPVLNLEASAPTMVDELAGAVGTLRGAVTAPLAEAGEQLLALSPSESAAVVETWLDDVTLVEPRLAFWVQVAAGPVLELGARDVTVPEEWSGAACPVCGGPPQASVIAEESGEFMAGSPRSLVCGRCASWWPFARVTCTICGEEDPRHIESFMVEGRRLVRVDTCATCRGYIKTFDLREPGAVGVVPLVDDVATLTLDVWARERAYSRSALSLAGV